MVQTTKPAEFQKSADVILALGAYSTFKAGEAPAVQAQLDKLLQYFKNKNYANADAAGFGKNLVKLDEALYAIRDYALAQASASKKPEQAEAYVGIARAAENCIDEEAKAAKLTIPAQKLQELSRKKGVKEGNYEHPAQTVPRLETQHLATGTTPAEVVVNTLPDTMAKFLAPGAQQNTVRGDLGAMLTADSSGNKKQMAAAGKQLWDDLQKFNPNRAEAMVCGDKAGTSSCSSLLSQLKKGNYSALFDGDYPMSETLDQARNNSTRTQKQMMAYFTEGVRWHAPLDTKHFALEFHGEVFQIGKDTISTTYEGGAEAKPKTKTNYSVGGELSAIPILKLTPRTELSLEAGAKYFKPFYAEGYQLALVGEVKLKGAAGISQETGLSQFNLYFRTEGSVTGGDRLLLRGGGDSTLTLFHIGPTQIGVFGGVDALRETAKEGPLEYELNSLQMRLAPAVQARLREGVPAYLLVVAGPTVSIQSQGGFKDPTALWGGFLGVATTGLPFNINLNLTVAQPAIGEKPTISAGLEGQF